MSERVHCKRCGQAFATIPEFDAHCCPDQDPDAPDDGMLLADGGESFHVLERADGAYHDVAQLHLHEFGGVR